jgi:hypothetical protein
MQKWPTAAGEKAIISDRVIVNTNVVNGASVSLGALFATVFDI